MWQVRHPGVALRIHQDFQIMGWIADVAQRIPALKWLNLRQSVDQFSHTMTAQVKRTEGGLRCLQTFEMHRADVSCPFQADLRVEAQNLQRFRTNFHALSSSVVFPQLVPHLVSPPLPAPLFLPCIHYCCAPPVHPSRSQHLSWLVRLARRLSLRASKRGQLFMSSSGTEPT